MKPPRWTASELAAVLAAIALGGAPAAIAVLRYWRLRRAAEAARAERCAEAGPACALLIEFPVGEPCEFAGTAACVECGGEVRGEVKRGG